MASSRTLSSCLILCLFFAGNIAQTLREWEVDERCFFANKDIVAAGAKRVGTTKTNLKENDDNRKLLRGGAPEDDARELQNYSHVIEQLGANHQNEQQQQGANEQAGDDVSQQVDEQTTEQIVVAEQAGGAEQVVEQAQVAGQGITNPVQVEQQPQVAPQDGMPMNNNPQEGGAIDDDSFNLRLHWYPGACWQDEWRERQWCMQCPGNNCDEDDWIWVEECAHIAPQRFQWIMSALPLEGQIKTAYWNLCLERASTRLFVLKTCDATNPNQLFFRTNMGDIFELHPAHNHDMCLTQMHHPKDYEEVFARTCDLARESHTSFWNTNWSPPEGANAYLDLRPEECSSLNPCGRCTGDCDHNGQCDGDHLTCFFRDDDTPVPGCHGVGIPGRDYCTLAADVALLQNTDQNLIAQDEEVVLVDNTTSAIANNITIGTVQFRFPKCTEHSPCVACEGYCEVDSECEGDLQCVQSLDSVIVGCEGTAAMGFTYCMDTNITASMSDLMYLDFGF